ncbi:MAG: LPS export ABC transporter periplasmic protein LptC [Candidatus Riflebacteria bacterium]|nr:LPS export ABC transporter periplasmic protein LptC [Candidatus Riflebacteria bacterium]NCB47121.1 LPS export ABC transporter periplasmic protein LptC [bacterium]NLV94996.1 LPS export ABC transporter periplasmic protein LptC [Candidatus Riflebacteria bacterium]
MIKNILLSFWFWSVLLVAFIVLILWDDDLEEGIKAEYIKHRMVLNDVNFSQIDKGFESARLYADTCEMDDNQNNMEANNVRVIMFKENVATWTGRLISEKALKSPFEAKFWGDVRLWNSDDERFRTEEMRYYINRKEMHTQKPVTAFKDKIVVTGLGMSYFTETQELKINQQVVIRIWNDQKEKKTDEKEEHNMFMGTLPVAPPIENILQNKLEIRKEDKNKSGVEK